LSEAAQLRLIICQSREGKVGDAFLMKRAEQWYGPIDSLHQIHSFLMRAINSTVSR
jgi:hypothetical protein